MRIKKLISDNYSNPNFRYSDEETFFDLKDRILKIFNYFKNSKDKDILVISHGHIMAFIIGMMMTKNKLRPSEYQKIDKEVNLNNASVTIASEDGPDRWSFPIFNYHGFLKKHTGIMGLENNKKQNLKRINLV
jgi:broad specificity phosphatase PhoE